MIVCRADATPELGGGHVARCLALADVLIARGETVRFMTCAPPAMFASRGIELVEDPGDASWIVVDHYGLGADWERSMRPRRILAIDDLARAHDCDVLLDQNFVVGADQRYAGKLPAHCRALTGPHYALLRPEFAAHRAPPKRGPIRSVLISFGLTDPPGESAKAIAAARDRGLAVHVVTGSLNPRLDELRRAARQASHVELHVDATNMAELLAASDLAIGAVGSSTWERFCVGVPAITATLAENQEETAQALAAAGLIRHLGRSTETTVATYVAALDAALENPDAMHAMAVAAAALVDGRGAERVADQLGER